MDDDELITQIGALGKAINASKDEDLDPDQQALASRLADATAEQLVNEHNRRR
ncbi:hypothetical protein [Streptomyces sp. NPDC005970]|uniref:hypothetical protein n=1 Tax=Streptomyces sp. NPDC005970 TaxID=3156723 RepID=UPI00340FC235